MNDNFRSISDKELIHIMKEDKIPLIDVRREEEWHTFGIIEGSHKITFFDAMGQYNAEDWLSRLDNLLEDKDSPFVLICAHANRTKVIGQFLNEIGYTDVLELDGGINYGWLDKGWDTVRD
jgi:rhodanese-related sulfurtransferase